ncbi:uncharacterized protein TNCV_3941181 [Trichonephila clavipes]|uniref:Transcription cofactor vestigial-like protein 2 n=1 Tax=Trichonephila clavipes TaxID=2585209 RepID=A0A8X6VW00_TRICX|nr:uncharacterized protein TNCV_3941181 [Trichonephila clavipes]
MNWKEKVNRAFRTLHVRIEGRRATKYATASLEKFSSVKPPLVEGSSPAPSPPTEGEKGAEKAEAQYLSANCVLFTYYSGDISSVVDEHFARALSQAAYAAPAPPEAKGSSAPLHSSKGKASLPSSSLVL